jgi:hypothetical protein
LGGGIVFVGAPPPHTPYSPIVVGISEIDPLCEIDHFFINNPHFDIETYMSVDAICIQIPYKSYLSKYISLLLTMRFLLEML